MTVRASHAFGPDSHRALQRGVDGNIACVETVVPHPPSLSIRSVPAGQASNKSGIRDDNPCVCRRIIPTTPNSSGRGRIPHFPVKLQINTLQRRFLDGLVTYHHSVVKVYGASCVTSNISFVGHNKDRVSSPVQQLE